MAAQTLGIVLVLIAAAIEALSNVLQHKATNTVDKGTGSEASALLRTLKKPMFLGGFLLMILGFAFHIASLGFGANVAVIQVIFVTQLVFIIPFARIISKTHVSGSDWLGALVVTVGIGLFVAFASPEKGYDDATNGQWLLAIGIVSAICAVSIVVGYMFQGGTRAALLGVSGGVINGLVAVLITGTIDSASQGNIFANWLVYVTLIAALLGVLFPLMAFRSGPITASFPAVMALNPVTAALLGVYLFHQDLQSGVVPITMMVISGAIILVGIVWLSRSKAISDAFEDHGHSGPESVTETATLL